MSGARSFYRIDEYVQKRILKLSADGLSSYAIAKIFNLTGRSVQLILKKHRETKGE